MIPLQPDPDRPIRTGNIPVDRDAHMRHNEGLRRTNAANFVIGYMNHALSKGTISPNRDAKEFAQELVDAALHAYQHLGRKLDDIK